MIIFGQVNIMYADDLTATDTKASVATKLINTNNIHVPYKHNNKNKQLTHILYCMPQI